MINDDEIKLKIKLLGGSNDRKTYILHFGLLY